MLFGKVYFLRKSHFPLNAKDGRRDKVNYRVALPLKLVAISCKKVNNNDYIQETRENIQTV